MSTVRLADDPTLVTPVFRAMAVPDPYKSKAEGRPIFNDVEVVDIYLAANKQTVVTALAHECCGNKVNADGVSEPITYAMRYNKQYLEFKSGGVQGIVGTPLSELPFLTEAKRLELKALNVHNAEALAALDGASLKMLGPSGRDLKNQAEAYIENAKSGAGAAQLHEQLDQQRLEIEALKSQIASLASPDEDTQAQAKDETVKGFETFDDDDLRTWLTEAGVGVDGRWKRQTLLVKAEEILAVQGKAHIAA